MTFKIIILIAMGWHIPMQVPPVVPRDWEQPRYIHSILIKDIGAISWSNPDSYTFVDPSARIYSPNRPVVTRQQGGNWLIAFEKEIKPTRSSSGYFSSTRSDEERELLPALSCRRLSHYELLRVTPHLNILPNSAYFPCVKYAELYDLLLKQAEFQFEKQRIIKTSLSRRLGEYNRCPQEIDNQMAVEGLIAQLREAAAEREGIWRQ